MDRTIRPPARKPAPQISDRTQARLQRQRMLELQQEAADLEALKMTPEQFKILQDTFADVSIEFSDLDGLSWDTPEAREALRNWHAQQVARQHSPSADRIGLRVRGARTRHSLSALLSPPPSSPPVAAAPMSRTTSVRLSMGDDGDESNEGTVRERLAAFESADMRPASPGQPLPSQHEEDRVQASDGSASTSEQPAAALSQDGMSGSCSAPGVSESQHSAPSKPSAYSAWRPMLWRSEIKMFRNISPVLGPSITDSEATSSVPASTSAPVSLATLRLSSRRRCSMPRLTSAFRISSRLHTCRDGLAVSRNVSPKPEPQDRASRRPLLDASPSPSPMQRTPSRHPLRDGYHEQDEDTASADPTCPLLRTCMRAISPDALPGSLSMPEIGTASAAPCTPIFAHELSPMRRTSTTSASSRTPVSVPVSSHSTSAPAHASAHDGLRPGLVEVQSEIRAPPTERTAAERGTLEKARNVPPVLVADDGANEEPGCWSERRIVQLGRYASVVLPLPSSRRMVRRSLAYAGDSETCEGVKVDG